MVYRKTAERVTVATCYNVGQPAGICCIPAESNMFVKALAYVIKSMNRNSAQDSENAGKHFQSCPLPSGSLFAKAQR